METVEQYLKPWITYTDLVAPLRDSLVLDQTLGVDGPSPLLLFSKAPKPTQTILTVNKTLLPLTSVTSFRLKARHFAVRVTLTIAH